VQTRPRRALLYRSGRFATRSDNFGTIHSNPPNRPRVLRLTDRQLYYGIWDRRTRYRQQSRAGSNVDYPPLTIEDVNYILQLARALTNVTLLQCTACAGENLPGCFSGSICHLSVAGTNRSGGPEKSLAETLPVVLKQSRKRPLSMRKNRQMRTSAVSCLPWYLKASEQIATFPPVFQPCLAEKRNYNLAAIQPSLESTVLQSSQASIHTAWRHLCRPAR
jgi:hypothetical protein